MVEGIACMIWPTPLVNQFHLQDTAKFLLTKALHKIEYQSISEVRYKNNLF